MSAAPPKSYTELYQALISNSYSVVDYMDFKGDSGETPAELRALVYDLVGQEILCFAYYCYADNQPFIRILHRMFKFRGLEGREDETVQLALVGDYVAGMPPEVVTFPTSAFAVVNVTCKKPTAIDTHLESNPALEMGPYGTSEPETEMIQTRCMVPIPYALVGMFLPETSLTPQEAWRKVGGHIRAQSPIPTSMKPVLQWLQAALTTDSTGVSVGVDSLQYPTSRQEHYMRYISSLLARNLPGRGNATPHGVSTNSTGNDTVAAITTLTGELTRRMDAGTLSRTPPKTPSSYYGEGTLVLNRLTHTGTPADLPLLYHKVSQSTKKTERLIVAEYLRSIAMDIGLPGHAPLVTPSLAKKITTANFGHHNLDDLEAGIHPFLTTYKDPMTKTQLEAIVNTYDNLLQGAGAQLEDLAALKKGEVTSIPSSLAEITYTFKSFRILLYAILGDTHTLSAAWDRFLHRWQSVEMDMGQALTTLDSAGKIVRWTQIRISNWFTDQVNEPGHVPAPDFNRLITDIRNQEPIRVDLPTKYRRHQPRQTQAAAPTQSSIRTITTSSTPAATPAGTGRGDRVNNTNYNDAIYGWYKALGLRVAGVRDKARDAGKPVPTNQTGTEHCLSYHVLGFCWSNCRKAEDHRQQQPAEQQVLTNWCATCWREGGPE